MIHSGDIPIYKKIADDYKRRILSGELVAGSLIPAQTELAAIHGTSEVTIRKALKLLVDDGLIYRVKKKGTFVRDKSDVPVEKNSGINSISRVYLVNNAVPVPMLTMEIHKSMFDGIADACAAHGIELILHNTRKEPQLPNDPEAGYLLWGFDWKSVSVIEKWKQAGYNMVTLHNWYPHLDIPYVNCDNYTGSYLATQHLLSLGHKRVGIILLGRSPHELYHEWAFRLQGFNLALRNNGIPYAPELVVIDTPHRKDLDDFGYDLEDLGYRGMQKLMALSEPPTAVFAAADFAALGAMKAAEDLGLSIPDDVSLISYDGYSFGQYTVPALTTVNQNFYNLGRTGLEKLLNVSSQVLESLVVPELIVRSSTKAR